MNRPTAVVTRRWPQACESALAQHFDVRLNPDDQPMSSAQLQDALRSVDALFPTVTDQIDAKVLGVEPLRAKFIGSFGVGFNHIDLDAARKRGLVVTNTPEVLTDCTADLAMQLLLTVARRAGEGERHVRSGAWTGWRPTHMMGTRVSGKTLGVIGFGRIGHALARRAHRGFGMRVIFHDPFPPPPDVVAALSAEPRESVDAVLAEADFVSLHCPALAETRHLMNAERLARMKPEAFLINTARGDVVEEAALIEALRAGAIAGAGLDVHEHEPRVSEALLSMENVVLLPHLGSATRETRIDMGMRVLENALAFFAGEKPRDRLV